MYLDDALDTSPRYAKTTLVMQASSGLKFFPTSPQGETMSEILLAAIPESTVHANLAAAVLAGCDCDPDGACEAVATSLSASFGPIVQQIINLIKSGLTNLPAILAALAATGIVLPPWVSLVVTILLAVITKPAA